MSQARAPFRSRPRLALLAGLALAVVLVSTAAPASATGAGPVQQAACDIPHGYLLRIWNDYVRGRSGEIQVVPRYPNFMDGGISHAGPWGYVQKVPLFLYGPGYVNAGVRVDRAVRSIDIAPTLARLLRFSSEAWVPDGKPLTEALVAPRPAEPPRVLVVVVWDAAGRNVLSKWPDSWGNLAALLPHGTWYEHATVGSSPSVTGPIHASIGTGDLPRHHGIVDDTMRLDGQISDAWGKGPASVSVPTLADLYDQAHANRSKVVVVATEPWHVGMIGHGSQMAGGDRDLAALKLPSSDLPDWRPGPRIDDFYRYPAYVENVGGILADAAAVDLWDGVDDGRWLTHGLNDRDNAWRSPARIPYQTRVLEKIMTREGFGQDDVPDLVFINYKLIDMVEHIYNMTSPEMRDAVRGSDEGLPLLISYLNDRVGEGKWAMVLTADHGSTDPTLPGVFRIKEDQLKEDLQRRFGGGLDGKPILDFMRPTQVWFDMQALQQAGYGLAQVSNFLLRYTQGDNQADPPNPDRTVFAAAFPSRIMPSLPCLPEARR